MKNAVYDFSSVKNILPLLNINKAIIKLYDGCATSKKIFEMINTFVFYLPVYVLNQYNHKVFHFPSIF